MRDDVVERHHRPRDQVPLFGQAHRKNRLKVLVVVPLPVVQLEVIKLIRYRPDAAHRVGKLSVQFARGWFASSRLLDGDQAKILAALQRRAKWCLHLKSEGSAANARNDTQREDGDP